MPESRRRAAAAVGEETQYSGREASAAGAAAAFYYLTTGARRFPRSESVCLRTLTLFWLIGSLRHVVVELYTLY